MKKIMLLAFVISASGAAFSQQKEIRLIVRGDDMGFSHAGNEALIKCYEEGIERSIEVIVPSPWFPEAVKLLAEHPDVDVGIHITFTSEWDNIKYRPVSDCPSLKDSSGYFYPMIWPNKNYPGQALLQNKWNIADIEKEMRAQIELAKRKIPRVSHLSAHMGSYDMDKEVTALTKKLAAEYNLDIDPKDYNVKHISYDGPSKTSAEKINSLLKQLESLQPGETYLFVDHPCLNTPEARAIHHIGYENVAEDRQGVVDSWTDKRVKDLIKKRNIKLISYADLKR
jgi:predicted glycoside hydrolase/deacetylase ChbG (UPF0249 family)